jgi:hypothetical protein
MDPKFSATFKAALNLWVSGAMGQIDGHPEEIGELRKCMEGDWRGSHLLLRQGQLHHPRGAQPRRADGRRTIS